MSSSTTTTSTAVGGGGGGGGGIAIGRHLPQLTTLQDRTLPGRELEEGGTWDRWGGQRDRGVWKGCTQMRRVFKNILALHIHFQLQATVFSYTHLTYVHTLHNSYREETC